MAFIGTFCSPCARCKVELFIKYPHTSLISQSIKTPACSYSKQAGVSFFFYPRYYQPFRSILCAASMPLLSLSFASELDSDIGSADICPRCPVLALSVHEVVFFSLYRLIISICIRGLFSLFCKNGKYLFHLYLHISQKNCTFAPNFKCDNKKINK